MFSDGRWKISNKVGTLYTTERCTGMLATTTTDEIKLWHTRLGHISEKMMKIVASSGKLPGFRSADMEFMKVMYVGRRKKLLSQKPRNS